MSMLTKVERKSRSGRLFLLGVFVLILLGSVTMVYPFLLMLSGSLRSDMDISQMTVVPAYLTDRAMLVRKFLETKYDYDPLQMNNYRQTQDYSFEQATVPAAPSAAAVEDFEAFANGPDMPEHWQVLGGTRLLRNMESKNLNELRARLRAYYGGDLAAFSRETGATMSSWGQFELLTPRWADRRYDYTPSPVFDLYFELLRERPVADRGVVSLTGMFLETVIYPEYGMTGVDDYNAAHARPIASYETLALPRRLPGKDQPVLRREWLQFIEDTCHTSFLRAEVPVEQFRAFLQDRFETVERLNQAWSRPPVASFEELELPGEREWLFADAAGIFRAFLETLDPGRLVLVGPEYAWQDLLRRRYGTLEALHRAHGSECASWEQCRMPQAETEALYVYEHTGALRRRFAGKNFRIVFDQIFVQGRPFYNTIVYVALTLLLALSVQPLAAYALSRFQPPGMWKLIFIFMATMAFPPMVGTIPMFLIIKELNLLNTFIALVLPVAVNGYLIFLLKGFFDSIPQHLYEAATIDGASELTMFWHITMALSKPILAVVALNAFRLAWMSFMYPLIVCPAEKMHVLAVWLHQFQMNAPTSAVFASILVASIPTLLIFLFTQGTIMKGIAVPAEK